MKKVWIIMVKSGNTRDVHSVSGDKAKATELFWWLAKTHPDLEYWIEERPMYDF